MGSPKWYKLQADPGDLELPLPGTSLSTKGEQTWLPLPSPAFLSRCSTRSSLSPRDSCGPTAEGMAHSSRPLHNAFAAWRFSLCFLSHRTSRQYTQSGRCLHSPHKPVLCSQGTVSPVTGGQVSDPESTSTPSSFSPTMSSRVLWCSPPLCFTI